MSERPVLPLPCDSWRYAQGCSCARCMERDRVKQGTILSKPLSTPVASELSDLIEWAKTTRHFSPDDFTKLARLAGLAESLMSARAEGKERPEATRGSFASAPQTPSTSSDGVTL